MRDRYIGRSKTDSKGGKELSVLFHGNNNSKC